MVNEGLSTSEQTGCAGQDTITCFVITPFGDDSSTSKEEARIFREIQGINSAIFRPVEKSFSEAGIRLEIKDAREWSHLNRDTIRAKVIELIDTADLVLIVMTSAEKPNAFIEYGWATGMWKTPIILKRKGFELPSNISNNLAIEYDPESLDGTQPDRAMKVARELKACIEGELPKYRRRVPFKHFPPTMLAHGTVDLLGRFRDVSVKEWSDALLAARKEIVLASSALLAITRQPFIDEDGEECGIQQILLKKALAGVRVTVVMQHPDNMSTGHLRVVALDKSEQAVREEQELAFKKWCTVRRQYDDLRRRLGSHAPEDGFRVIQMHDRFLPFRATLTDRRLYLTFRFYTQKYSSGLCLIAEPGPRGQDIDNPSIYSQIRNELEFLISENLERSEKNYLKWLREAE
jgi:hypothetical protein